MNAMQTAAAGRICSSVIVASCLLGLSTPVGAVEKIAIRLTPAVGEVWDFDQTMDVRMNNKGTLNGQTQAYETSMRQRRTGRAEVLAVRNGQITSAKIKFGPDCENSMTMNGQSQKLPFPFAGRTITVTRATDGSIQSDFNAYGDPGSMAELQHAIDPDRSIYPDREVGVGDEWEGNREALAKTFQLAGPNDKAGMTVKLLSVGEHAGRRAAELKVSTAAFKEAQGMTQKMVMQGTMWVDLATGRVLTGELKGTTSQSGKQTGPGPDGQPVTYDVEGEGTTTMTVNATPVAGVAGAPPRPAPPSGGAPAAAPAAPAGRTSFAGKFSDAKLTLELHDAGARNYAGTITRGTQTFKAAGTVNNGTLEGSFDTGGKTFPFTATLDGDGMTFKTGTATYNLKKQAANPLDEPAPANPLENRSSTETPSPRPEPQPAPANASVMHFVPYVLMDSPQGIGGEVARCLIPAGWKVEGGVVWDWDHLYNLADTLLRVYNPSGPESLAIYPKLSFYWTADAWTGQLLSNQRMYMGAEIARPLDTPFRAIQEITIPRYRKDLRSAKVVGTEEMPKLAEAIVAGYGQSNGWQVSARAGRMRFETTQNGQPVQEDVYAVLTFRNAPQLRSGFWDVERVFSVRGPKGKLEELAQLYQTIESSSRPNLEWFNKYVQINQAVQNTQAEGIRQAGIRSRIISQANDQISDTIRQSYANTQASYDRISLARSQYMRGVTPYDTGDGRHVDLPSNYQHAWRGNDGTYVVSNDPNYDPNRDASTHTNWTQLQPTR